MARAATTSDVFNAIAEPRRRDIIELLAKRPGSAVGTIVLALGLPQSAVSKHLGVLRKVGIVSVTTQGKSRIYDLNPSELQPVRDWVKTLEQHWNQQLGRIAKRAEARVAEMALGKLES